MPLLRKLVQGLLATPAISLALTLIGYVEGGGAAHAQSPDTLARLKVLFFALPCVFILLAAIASLRFLITPAAHAVIRREIERLRIVRFDGLVTLRARAAGAALELSFEDIAPRYNRLTLELVAAPSEHIYGGGEQFSALDLRGRKVPVWVEEQGGGRGRDLITLLADLHSGSGGSWHTTYYAQPTFVSSANYACHLDATSYAELDFRRPDRHLLSAFQIPAAVRIEVGGSAPEVIGKLSVHLGRQPELPAWAYEGVWLGVQGGAAVAAEKLRRAREAGVKVAAIWAQDWEGIRMTSFGKQLRWDYRVDPALYPDLPAFIARLGEDGVRFLGYVNPMLVTDGALLRRGQGARLPRA